MIISQEERLRFCFFVIFHLSEESMGKLKEKFYNFFVRKNEAVREDYERYVIKNQEEHYSNRLKHWSLLLKLNWHYRIRKKTTPYFNTDKKIVQPICFAESLYAKRTNPDYFAKGLLEFDVISFDIFDTLILRKLNEPTDVFSLVGNILGCWDFKKIRTQAEHESRTEKMALSGNREIDIYEIYKRIERVTNIDVATGVKTELNVEKDICFANPYMKIVFDILKSKGKTIIATSDMYLPKELMVELLESCGYTGFANVIVSCEHNCSKSNGLLYKHVKNLYKSNSIVHIGDNMEADILQARASEIKARHYKKCSEFGNQFREPGMSAMAKSSYYGFINSELHNGTNKFSELYEYGFIYGGYAVFAFVRWIHEQAVQDGIEKVLFFSRDGYIYKKVYDMMYSDIPSEYVLWSRIASLKYGFIYAKNSFLVRMVDHKTKTNTTISQMLSDIGLYALCPKLNEYHLSPSDLIHKGNAKIIKSFFAANWDAMEEIFSVQSNYAKCYYSSMIGNCKKVATVDVGWSGNNQLIFKRIIENKWNCDCKISSYMFGSTSKDTELTCWKENDIKAFMFSSYNNRINFDKAVKGINTVIFELLSQAPTPTFSGFSNDGKLLFDYAEVENYDKTKEIINGIMDFCKKYYDSFNKYDVFLNISGYDAFVPFRGFLRNEKKILNTVGDFKISVHVQESQKKSIKMIITESTKATKK